MNIHPKFSHADLAGVIDLMAFLADKTACVARLKELQAAADAADAAEAQAKNAQAKAVKAQDAALKAQGEAFAQVAQANAQAEALEKIKADQGAQAAELAAHGSRLAAWENSLTAKTVAADQKAEQLTLRESAVAAAEKAVAELRAEYDAKIKTLRSLAGA